MHAYNMCMYVHACICWDVYVVNMQKYAVNVQAIQVLHTDIQTDTPMEPGDYKGETIQLIGGNDTYTSPAPQ